ncbi:MotE family protein [Pseudooceanicola algae]|uniref:Uncharacterized protein n=1 Tax=Pseudooceanicola algae TaxID=1537215 RepID=A0A418SAY2_9RHOB|nr:hypothetical protein [Pseudooceanicola algae]QPM91278.1 hypothetical protein PSAL_025310 [Pseudooceanicola algae]
MARKSDKTAKRPAQPAPPKARKGARRKRRGSLPLIAGLLLASAALRVGLHSSEVLALDSAEEPHEAAMGVDMPEGNTALACEPDPDVAAMLEAFKTREARLDQRESQIRDRMNALSIADEEIEKKLAQLAEAEEALRATLALADNAAENDISRLVAVYENMKPKDAATLFEQMDPDFAAGFLGRMRPEAAAAVMSGLTPERAYTISVVLAGRNSSVPKD